MDGEATVKWMRRQAWCNGKVGVTGDWVRWVGGKGGVFGVLVNNMICLGPSDERRIICIILNVDIDYTDDIPMAAKTPRPGKLYYPFIRNWLVESSSNSGNFA